MKKRIVLALTIFHVLILSSHLSAFDLWSGLDTDMTKDQVVTKAREVLEITRPNVESSGEKLEIFSFDKASLNNQFPNNLTETGLVSPLSGYARQYYLDKNFNKDLDRPLPNIRIYFSNNRLFALSIYWDWEITPDQLLEMLKKQNGNPTETIIVNNGYGDSFDYYIWEKAEKITYCIGRAVYVVNKQMIKK